MIDWYFEVDMFENYVNTHVPLVYIKNMIIVSLDAYECTTMYYLILQNKSVLFREHKL